jgi:hypothetical protein
MNSGKVKSVGYLNFLSKQRCVITGSSSFDIHHESLLREYSGSLKSHNDYQALPVSKSLHIHGRHDLGKQKFWAEKKINPYAEAIRLLRMYLLTAPEDFEEASYFLDKIIDQSSRWEHAYSEKYKSM